MAAVFHGIFSAIYFATKNEWDEQTAAEQNIKTLFGYVPKSNAIIIFPFISLKKNRHFETHLNFLH